MSTLFDDDTSTTATTASNVNTDYLMTTFPDGTPIEWDGNYATILGKLEECNKFYKRTGTLKMFIHQHAVPLRNGRLAVDHLIIAYFLHGFAVDEVDLTVRGRCAACAGATA